MPAHSIPPERHAAPINTSLKGGKPILASLEERYGTKSRKGEHIAAAVLFAEAMLRSRKTRASELKKLYEEHMRSLYRNDKHTGQLFD